MPIVMFGIGSPIAVDVAETCIRLGLAVAAWVRNVEGAAFAPPQGRVLAAQEVSRELLAHPFSVPLFTPGHRRAACLEARSLGFAAAATLADPTAIVASSTVLAPGCYLNSLVNIGGASQLGEFVFVNRGASIGHHVEIADFASIGPAAVIAGGVRIGRGAVVGAGAVVLPGIAVGANAVVGAGAAFGILSSWVAVRRHLSEV